MSRSWCMLILFSVSLQILSACGYTAEHGGTNTASTSPSGLVSAATVSSQESGEPVLVMIGFVPGL